MMCSDLKEKLGPYVDDHLPATEAQGIADHLAECDRCRDEVDRLRALAVAIAQRAAPQVPAGLWESIERRLPARSDLRVAPGAGRRLHVLVRVAAVILLAAGLGALSMFWQSGENSAQAATIDFGIMLDALPLDAPKAFSRFLTFYRGTEIRPSEARSFAPDLSFEAPAMLPGGFQRVAVYGLRFGSNLGVAARYERDGEFLAAIFHPTVHPEQFGTHRDYPCVVGDHHGHRVRVGEWQLVHVTDPITCHCVLSRLNEGELAAVLETVAPHSRITSGHAGEQHGEPHP